MTIKRLSTILLLLLLSLLHTFSSAWSRSSLPSPHPVSLLTDLSGTLNPEYLAQLESRLQRYPFEVRVLYLPETRNLQLAFYAEKVFQHWQMPPDSVLLVVALDRRKIGIYTGPELRQQLKQKLPGKEVSLPSPNGQPKPENKPAKTEKKDDYLEMLPEIVGDLSQASQVEKNKTRQTQATPSPEEVLLETSQKSSQSIERKPITPGQMLPLYIFFGLLVLTGGLILGMRLWQKRQANQELIGKFSLEGQAAYNEIENLYGRLDTILPEFHTYQGVTQAKLSLFLKEVHQLQNQYDEIFDRYEEEVRLLGDRQQQMEAIDFFQNLEKALSKGQKLLTQAQLILRNLEELKQSNQNQLEQLQNHKQSFSQALHELKKLHPHLKLTRLSPVFQQHHESLLQMEQLNQKDPMQVEKQLQEWLKELRRLEREVQSLPHLWLQFNQELRLRVDGLKTRATQKPVSASQTRQLDELLQLHRHILQAIEHGELEKISSLNNRFTARLQSLESEI